ncbi:iron chelate uptake ABC transporter family permease subunit [Peredibacter sp. HCB2-198]|uniref:iron chelate uptake ABC transporter family permease subunit n=1 Tax=Peredibacter sp. HCB2-198 TaxID=3383025 RepID=UPI0038B5653B
MDYLIPRFLCAFLSGAILSQTGSLIQMGTRNILASPSTLGFDGLSILWILILHSVLLLTGYEHPVTVLFLFGVPVFAIVGIFFSKFIGQSKNIERLILLGLTFNLLVGAVFSLWQFLFLAFNLPFPVELWFGHFRFANPEALGILVVLEFLILFGWWRLSKEFLLFSLGKNLASNWKLEERTVYKFLFLTVAIGTFTVISLFGAFSFMALVFPIFARKLWFKKFDLAGEFLIGGLANGLLLMAIDSACYYFPIFGAEIPVGLIATAVGALSLIFLLWTSKGPMEIVAKTKK